MRRKGFHSLSFLDIKEEKSPLATSVTWSSLGSLDRVPKMAVSTGLSVAEEGRMETRAAQKPQLLASPGMAEQLGRVEWGQVPCTVEFLFHACICLPKKNVLYKLSQQQTTLGF